MATSPIEVGTRGTIASLVSQEIDYFRKLNLKEQASTQGLKTPANRTANGSSSAPKKCRKKSKSKMIKSRRNSGGFLPRICSFVEIAENGNMGERTVGVGYRNLKADGGSTLEYGL